jgi:hypothetical protein
VKRTRQDALLVQDEDLEPPRRGEPSGPRALQVPSWLVWAVLSALGLVTAFVILVIGGIGNRADRDDLQQTVVEAGKVIATQQTQLAQAGEQPVTVPADVASAVTSAAEEAASPAPSLVTMTGPGDVVTVTSTTAGIPVPGPVMTVREMVTQTVTAGSTITATSTATVTTTSFATATVIASGASTTVTAAGPTTTVTAPPITVTQTAPAPPAATVTVTEPAPPPVTITETVTSAPTKAPTDPSTDPSVEPTESPTEEP